MADSSTDGAAADAGSIDLEDFPSGIAHNDIRLSRRWREHIGAHGGDPADELPALRSALEAAGFAVEVTHTAPAKYLQLEYEYTQPDGPDPRREVALLTVALWATEGSDEWAANGVTAESPTIEWSLADDWTTRPSLGKVINQAVGSISTEEG